MAAVVTLVHGTWGSESPFLLEGSPLRKTLSLCLGDETIFRIFTWSGRNNHRSRISASIDLKAFLREGSVRFPAADHYVVAHSHGGNVLTYALRDPDIRRSLRGAICLASPFLLARPLPVPQKSPGCLAVVMVSYSVILVPLVIAVGLSPSWLEARAEAWLLALPENVGEFLTWITLVMLAAIAIGLFVTWARVSGQQGQSRQNEVLDNLSQPVLDCPPVLCIRVAADEAALGIKTAVTLGSGDQILGPLLLRLREVGMSTFTAWVAFVICFAVVDGCYQGFTGDDSILPWPADRTMPWWGWLIAVPPTVGGALWAFSHLLLLQLRTGAPITRILQNLAVGPDRASDALLVAINIKSEPDSSAPGLIEHMTLQLRQNPLGWLKARRGAKLRHMLPYTDGTSLEHIAGWLQRLTRESHRPPV